MATALQYMRECPVCFNDFKEPKVLPCDHTLCRSCVERMKQGHKIKCPICNGVYDTGKVRADFRLVQFLEALNEREQEIQPPKQEQRSSCRLCSTRRATHWCGDCHKQVCDWCQQAHQEAANTRHHAIIPLSAKCREVKAKIEKESKNFKPRIYEYTTRIDVLQDELFKLKSIESDSLGHCEEIRRKSLKDVNNFFDKMSAKIKDFIGRKTDVLEKEKAILEKDLDDFESQWQQLDKMVREHSARIAEEGEAILKRIHGVSIIGTSLAEFHTADVVIKIAAGKGWDATQAMDLEIQSEGTESKPQIKEDTKNLLPLTAKQFKLQNHISLVKNPWSIRLINGNLWACQDNGIIQIFSQDLKLPLVSHIANKSWGCVYDVTEMPNGNLVLACANGLFNIKPDGEQLGKLDSGDFKCVAFFADRLFAYDNGSVCIRIYKFTGSWQKSDVVKIASKDFVTFTVTQDTVIACSCRKSKVIVIPNVGKLRHTHGEKGSGQAGKLCNAYLCQEDRDGSLLVADESNNRLQVLNRSGKWNILQMRPQPQNPRRGVFIDNKFYVVSTGGAWKLSVYVED